MNKPPEFTSAGCQTAFLLVLALFLAGCKSTPKVDWNTRIGSFTYDLAVLELGPPDKSAPLSNGDFVAEWLVKQTQKPSFSVGFGGYGGNVGAGASQTMGGGMSGEFLLLTFGPDQRLKTWSKQTR